MKKILYISYDGMSDQLGQSQVMPYLISLAKFGYNISLISCEKKNAYQQHKEELSLSLKNAGINWYPTLYLTTPPIISTLLNIKKIRRLANSIVKNGGIHIVHCRSYIAALVGVSLKRKYGVRFVFDMRGFWADERLDGGIWNTKNPIFNLIYQYFKRKEKEFLLTADAIISLTKNAKNEILSWDGINIDPDRISVIPCCADLDLFSSDGIEESDLAEYKKQLKIEDDELILVYLGALGTWYMLNEMLDFFVRLKKKVPKSRFLLLTRDDKADIYNISKGKGIKEESLIIKSASRAQVPVFLKLAHLSVFFIKPLYSKKASSPTKQGELMGMGVPIICNAGIGDSDEIIREFKSGFLINEFTNDNYDVAVAHVDQLLKIDKRNIREGARAIYSLEKGVNSYKAVYEKLLAEK